MSQNRGYRRDGRQNYQMNSSGHYGGRSGGQMNVNPWEGGMVPGGRSGVAGLLPTPQTGSLFSQLSNSPEAQLALASNLLSTILRPQQQPQVPSLLSLDSMGPMGGSGGMGYRGSGYGPGRYDDPGPNRRKRMDNRRADPYNKSQQGRRNASARGGAERKTSGNQGLRSPSLGKSRSSVSKSGAKADRKDDDIKKEKDLDQDKTNDDEKNEEDSKREDGEEGEKKRDWKDEKADDEGKNDKSKEGSTRYAGIPPSLLYCHVCKKHMWDENSFQNHLKGRTHQLMMDKLEESYKIRVELMRHEQKVAEQQREIELERMKRQGKKVNMNIREYCTMCDLHFFGNLIVHRKNDRHQQLKNYLHPRCSPCGKEFPTRVEWDHHRLTPLHLRKTAEARSKSRKSGSDDEFGIEELISGKEEGEVKEIKVRTREEEEEEIKEAERSREEDGDEGKDESAGDGEDKDGDDKTDGETTTVGNLRFRVPKYNPDVAVGLSLLKKMTGQTCRACHRFFINSEDAKTHCRTLMHYNNFVALVKEKAKAAEAKERREKKEEEKEKEEDEKGIKRSEDMSTADDEGNWKRRKVANDEDEDEDGESEKRADAQNESKEGEEDEKDDAGDEKEEEAPMETDECDEEDTKTKSDKEAKDEAAEDEIDEKDTDSKEKVKKGGESADDQLWSEVDRDIGNLLDTVDGDGGDEDLNEEELLNPKSDIDSPGKGTRSSRNKATRGGSSSANKAVRGRKKK